MDCEEDDFVETVEDYIGTAVVVLKLKVGEVDSRSGEVGDGGWEGWQILEDEGSSSCLC